MIFLAFALALCALAWWYATVRRPKALARKELRRTCLHDRGWQYLNAFNDPRFPVRNCLRCGLQQHLEIGRAHV